MTHGSSPQLRKQGARRLVAWPPCDRVRSLQRRWTSRSLHGARAIPSHLSPIPLLTMGILFIACGPTNHGSLEVGPFPDTWSLVDQVALAARASPEPVAV